MQNLGSLLVTGMGVAKDLAESFGCYQKAAAQLGPGSSASLSARRVRAVIKKEKAAADDERNWAVVGHHSIEKPEDLAKHRPGTEQIASSRSIPEVGAEDASETSRKVHFRCPLSKRRIVTPVKGTRCPLVECVESRYISDLHAGSDRPSDWQGWRCPTCAQANGPPTLDIAFLDWLRRFPDVPGVMVDGRTGGTSPIEEAGPEETVDVDLVDPQDLREEREGQEHRAEASGRKRRRIDPPPAESKLDPRSTPRRLIYNPRFCDALLPDGLQCPQPWTPSFVDGRCKGHPRPTDRARSAAAGRMAPGLSERGAEVVVRSEPGGEF
ncbi:hypothetical protein DFJ74DRAFT_705334 [Hyaloraphidium curvatum]|nr:hypothetical protein DFJ74DRAFT_705334 [Hyaloraphidium curvatum]